MTFFAPAPPGGPRTAGPPIRRPPRAGGYLGRDLVGVSIYVGLFVSVALWWLDTPARSLNNRGELLIAGGRITGLAAGYLLLVTVLLRSRVGLLERFIGSEALGRWHRELGGALVVAILGHAALILVGYAVLDDLSWLRELNVLMSEYQDMTSAVVAVGILVGVGLLAIRAVRTVMPYELWKFLHLSTYAVLLLSYGHQFANGQQLFRPGLAHSWWIGLYVVVLACLA
jgi:predicted ferric reductase